ncbi:SAM-dependent methyltransferase HcgC family protein [Methanobacterium alcaliphilum]|uniref:SAM-dependent methyltransferase HcgC family protein n=1 Tax=Methanobacterium alcaliphilum TaxID=392018 RepID=UPI00200AB112|nr:SAM-dependent methyltransferase HcgC family protein [Methanobacterium alcaliphilum]MCK9152530.1 DUF1188 domain-containing protein [Methanobacterium alcaliphilum]
MKNKKTPKSDQIEPGITSTVKTIFSKTTVEDIINTIADYKKNAVLKYLSANNIQPSHTLIVGTYLTGAKIANDLVKRGHVTVVDIHPQVKSFLDSSVTFKNSIYELNIQQTFDLIVDTTGLGGLSSEEMNHLKAPEVFLAENPTSDGSDEMIKKIDATKNRLEYFNAPFIGQIFTEGLNTKTSGTMSLAVEVMKNSMHEVLHKEGVLYSVSSLDFYERILFQEKDTAKFLKTIQRPAIVVSSLGKIDPDSIIEKNLKKIYSKILVE